MLPQYIRQQKIIQRNVMLLATRVACIHSSKSCFNSFAIRCKQGTFRSNLYCRHFPSLNRWFVLHFHTSSAVLLKGNVGVGTGSDGGDGLHEIEELLTTTSSNDDEGMSNCSSVIFLICLWFVDCAYAHHFEFNF
jgi:hypothetical protein